MDGRVGRGLAYGMVLLALVVAVLVGLEVRYMGFPDGHLTELDRVRRPLYQVFVVINGALSGYFLYLGAGRQVLSKWVWMAVVGYGVLMVGALWLDYGLRFYFDHGAGG